MRNIDISSNYQTQCGFPVRNLHLVGFSFEGEYFLNGLWKLGAWLDNGKPDIFTTDINAINNLTLIEIPYLPPSTSQLSFFSQPFNHNKENES